MSNPWNPGGLERLPWAGLTALLGAIGGVAASIAVLIVSDGVPITKWPLQPTVYLSIISTLTNIMIHFALVQGQTTAWWTRAIKPNTKISDLHQYWKSGYSILAALSSARSFNPVALAAIAVAISPINGPFLQRASQVAVVDTTTDLMLSISLAPQVPPGYTGIVEGRGYEPSIFKQEFLPVVNDFYDRVDIEIHNTSCVGTCLTRVVGAGFALDCSSYQTLFNATPYEPTNTDFNTNQSIVTVGADAFESMFNWSPINPGILHIDVQYKPDAGCEGKLIVRNCTLTPATVQYNAIIDGNRSTISLPSTSTAFDDAIESHYNITEVYQSGSNTTIGGFYLALANRFNSRPNMRFTGAIGYTILTSGVTAGQFIVQNSTSTLECDLRFTDPTDILVANARELMFRTAIAAANSSNLQSVPAIQIANVAVYQSHYLYLGLASVFTLLAILFVIPTFFGYWHLGRRVSMSPIEIAKAFNAPIARGVDSNAEAEQLIRSLGQMDVRYGVVSAETVNHALEGLKKRILLAETDVFGRRLEIAASEFVTSPGKGWEFATQTRPSPDRG